MSDARPADKLQRELPRVRVTEDMELALMRAAAAQDRTLSDLIRVALGQWLYGHAPKVCPTDEKA
jgi:hypothetical protein